MSTYGIPHQEFRSRDRDIDDLIWHPARACFPHLQFTRPPLRFSSSEAGFLLATSAEVSLFLIDFLYCKRFYRERSNMTDEADLGTAYAGKGEDINEKLVLDLAWERQQKKVCY